MTLRFSPANGKAARGDHLQAVKAFQKAGLEVIRQSGPIVMPDGFRTIVIARNNPVNAFTMGGIVKDAGLTIEQFRELL